MRRSGVLSKRGSEYVEAALVLPIIILIMISIAAASAFCYRALVNQIELQSVLLKEAAASEALFEIKNIDNETSSHIQGLYDDTLSAGHSMTAYAVDEAGIIRLGRFADVSGDGQEGCNE